MLSEVTFSKYKARLAYTTARRSLFDNSDNFYPLQRVVVGIYKQLMTSNFCSGLVIGTLLKSLYEIIS